MRSSVFALGLASAFVLACTGEAVELAPPSRINALPVTPADALPLGVGEGWTYSVMEHRGAGFRTFGLTDKPATRTDLPDIVVMVLSVDDSQRYTVEVVGPTPEGGSQARQMTMWAEGDQVWFDDGSGKQSALTIDRPPNAVSTERLPCTAHYLGGITGACNARPGGPHNRAPGLNEGLVRQDADNLRGLAQILVGIGTAGIFIPGNRKATVTMELQHYAPGEASTPDNDWELWNQLGKADLPANHGKRMKLVHELAAQHGADAESVAAVVYSLSNAEMSSATPELIQLLPIDQRAAVVRVGMQRVDDDFWNLQLLARTAQLIPADEATRESVVRRVESDTEQARRLLSGSNPGLAAAYDQAKRPGKLHGSVLSAISAHPMNDDTVTGYVSAVAPSDRPAIIDAIQAAAPEPQRPRYLALGLMALGQDLESMQLTIAKHPATARAIDPGDKAAIVDAQLFDENKAPLRAALGM